MLLKISNEAKQHQSIEMHKCFYLKFSEINSPNTIRGNSVLSNSSKYIHDELKLLFRFLSVKYLKKQILKKNPVKDYLIILLIEMYF